MDLSAAEIKVILEMIQGAWASGSVRSPDMAGLLDSIKEKLEKKSDGGASK